jgi:hypothetical protein
MNGGCKSYRQKQAKKERDFCCRQALGKGGKKGQTSSSISFSDAGSSFCSLCLHNDHLQENVSPQARNLQYAIQALVFAHYCQVQKIFFE